ncbi:MAG: MarR family transcriptional regulator [Mesorhizobium sp.]|nr:MarR family transcriptional regulator [Mesorhizobium sp.]
MTPLSRKPGHLIRRLHQISTHVFARRVADAGFDLTPVQFAALDALGANQGVDQARLADLVAKDRATTGAVVDRLEQKGLVSRSVSARDKRARVLTLTPEGLALLARIAPVVEDLQREILRGLDDHEYRQFVELAAKAAAAASELRED